jgi:hypothetical protein
MAAESAPAAGGGGGQECDAVDVRTRRHRGRDAGLPRGEDRGGGQRCRSAGRSGRHRCPGQAHHAGHHRLPFAHGDRRRHQRERRRRSRPRCGSATSSTPPTSHLSAACRRRDGGQRPARLGQPDRRPEPGDQAPLGRLPEELKFAEAPAGIKFALGENVKQSNWGDRFTTTRYPQSRMGVEQIIRDAFLAARTIAPARRGSRPHAGCRRAATWSWRRSPRSSRGSAGSTATATARTRSSPCCACSTSSASRSARCSTSSKGTRSPTPWRSTARWARRSRLVGLQVRGLSTRFPTTAPDARGGRRGLVQLRRRRAGRHLNHEAAKAVKYGGVPPEEALKFVTLNPAKQLRIDEYVGSLEEGKHADLVVWSGDPLSNLLALRADLDRRPQVDYSAAVLNTWYAAAMRNP